MRKRPEPLDKVQKQNSIQSPDLKRSGTINKKNYNKQGSDRGSPYKRSPTLRSGISRSPTKRKSRRKNLSKRSE